MRHTLPVLATVISAALVAACGGAADGPTSPPAGTTLTIDFANIQIVEDCDGIEGDGDFTFTVETVQKNQAARRVYEASPNLGPGARQTLARTSTYEIPASDGETHVTVRFQGTEWDRSILGVTYADTRLAGDIGQKQHTFSNGMWSNLGVQTITLGSATPADCMVRLTYTAQASTS
jgi:hypothetical protein